ncbi:MAG TPA: hypothetical protein VFH95_00550 [Candidatus Kapabacteria bacterium]|nr:hypothetical protein [Candidatus Kapabacteria bacterium]
MFVTVANAPAGTKITGYCPYDTLSGGMPVTDSTGLPIVGSGYIFTDTSSGCNSDTLGFQFPFLIPAMANGDMGWEITLPAGSCSDIGNGRRIYLHGEVYAASNTPVYDSGQFMYGVSMTFVLDTTPPTATSFTLHAVDSTHLAVSLTGSDDTTIVNAGYVKYSVNGGSEVSQLLRVQHDSVGLTTIFVDTIISPFPHATINIRGFVANQLGLLDSTAIDTCNLPVIAPASVKDLSADGCHVELIQVDPADRTITLKFETTGGQLTLSLTDELGRVWPISPATNLAPGEEIITRTFPDLPHGAYFLRLQTGTCDVLEKVIL